MLVIKFELIRKYFPQFGIQDAAASLLMIAVYIGVGKMSLMLASLHPNASPVWPTAGAAISILLLFGIRFWPTILIGAFIVNLTTAGSAIPTSIGIACGNTLEAIVGLFLMKQFNEGIQAFDRVNTVLKFFFITSIVSAAVSATIGVGTLVLGNLASLENSPSIWLTWWLGNAVGTMTAVPLIVLWSCNNRHLGSLQETIEAAGYFAALILLACLVFLAPYFPYPYFTLVPILLISLRMSPRSAATAVVLLSCIAILGIMRDSGPFTNFSDNTSLLFLQAFIAVAAVTAMSFAASEKEKREFADSLEYKVKERTKELSIAREEDRAKLQQLKNILSQMNVAAVAADEHLNVLHANVQFRTLFKSTSDSLPKSTLPHIFKNASELFLDPSKSVAELLQLIGERKRVSEKVFKLKNGSALACDYMPIFNEGVLCGHSLVFRELDSK